MTFRRALTVGGVAALLLGGKVGDVFDGVITGVSKGNTWVRVFRPPAEGLLRGAREARVGQLGRRQRALGQEP